MAHHLDKSATDIADHVAAAGGDDELLSTTALAELTDTSTSFWEILRSKGHGPPFVRLTPRRVRYRRSDVCKWLRERTYEATARYSDDWDKPQGRPRGVASDDQLSSNTRKRPASAAMPAPAAADYLGIGLSSLYSLARDGKVESFTSGRRRLFTTASLDRYIEHRRTAEGGHFRPQNMPWERPKGTPRRHPTQSGKDKAAPASAAASDRNH